MTITVFLDPTQMPAQGQPQATFDNNVASLFSNLPTLGAQINATSANMNSIAAGGAYAIPYVGWGNSDPSTVAGANGRLVIPGTQNTVASIWFNILDARGKNTKLMFDDVFGSTSAVKGYVTITAVADPSRWISYRVTGWVYDATYTRGVLSVVCVGSSDANPIQASDSMVMQCQRTGDKGDPGSSQAVKFSDRKSSGTVGGTAVGNDATQVRTLNTTDYNTITSGVSLSSNQFTLPAGTYDIWGRAPFLSVGNFKANLYNVTDGTVQLFGSNGYSGTNGDQTDSVFEGRVTLAAPKTFSVRYYAATSGSTTALGSATSVANQLETYTEVIATKVA